MRVIDCPGGPPDNNLSRCIHLSITSLDTTNRFANQIVATLSQQLVSEFGSNFSTRNLWHMLRFAEVFPDEKIVNALSTQLGWTHFRQIITFGIRVAAYLTELPPRKLLQKKLHEAILLARARLEGKNGEQGKTEILS